MFQTGLGEFGLGCSATTLQRELGADLGMIVQTGQYLGQNSDRADEMEGRAVTSSATSREVIAGKERELI